MKVRCIANSAHDLPYTIHAEKIFGNFPEAVDRKFPIIIGNEYLVYGLIQNCCSIWYYICDEEYTYYPVWHPACLFEIIEGSVPIYWKIGFRKIPGQDDVLIISFHEWVDDPFFYDKLTDGDRKSIEIFESYKNISV